MNLVILSGRVATDIDCYSTSKGKLVAHFNLATPSGFKKGADGKVPTDFHRVTAWDKIAEHCRDFLAKGRSITLRGHLATNVRTKDGQRLRSSEVVADVVEFNDYRRQLTEEAHEDNRAAEETGSREEPSTTVGLPALSDMSQPDEPDLDLGIEVPW